VCGFLDIFYEWFMGKIRRQLCHLPGILTGSFGDIELTIDNLLKMK